MWNVAKEYTRISDAFTMGMEIGQIFWMIFYPTELYLDQSLADPNTEWGQDYTWDAIIYRRELEPGQTHQPLTDLPGISNEPTQFIPVEDDIEDISSNVTEFFTKLIPFFKTKANVGEPQIPNHNALRPKIEEI